MEGDWISHWFFYNVFPILFLQIVPTFLLIHDGPNFPFQIRPRSKYDRNESNTNYDLQTEY